MSCLGSATSGHGLTGHQVRCAIRCMIDELLKEWEQTNTEDGENLLLASLKPDDFKEVKEHETLVDCNPSEPKSRTVLCCSTQDDAVKDRDNASGKERVIVKSYFPKAFRLIRHLSGCSETDFASEWQLSSVDLQPGAGRSNALFFPSRNRKFLCKTISKEEVNVLKSILFLYTRHLSSYPSSYLTRFFMLMKLEVRNNEGYILCFYDICAKAPRIHEKWDLKGRSPKPGKYSFRTRNPNLETSPNSIDPSSHAPDALDQFEIGSPFGPLLNDWEGGEERPRTSIVSPPPNSDMSRATSPVTQVHWSHIKNAETARGTTVKVRKDKDLNRYFWLSPTHRGVVLKQLKLDYAFLKLSNLMDYSLFIAVCQTAADYNLKRHIRSIYCMRSPSGAVEERMMREGVKRSLNALSSQFASPDESDAPQLACAFGKGIPSFDGQESYYIGIIDMLTTYSWKKRTANFCKSLLWQEETLSTVPSSAYKKRLEAYTEEVLPDILVHAR